MLKNIQKYIWKSCMLYSIYLIVSLSWIRSRLASENWWKINCWCVLKRSYARTLVREHVTKKLPTWKLPATSIILMIKMIHHWSFCFRSKKQTIFSNSYYADTNNHLFKRLWTAFKELSKFSCQLYTVSFKKVSRHVWSILSMFEPFPH